MIDVAIIDDHPIARCGVEHALSARPNVRVTQSIGSPDELDTGASPPDVLLLDLYLNVDTPSLPAVAELSAWTKVLVMSASGRPRDVVGAIQAGARGYLTKHSSIEMFAQAVETVAAGGFAMSSELADVIHSELGAGPDARSRHGASDGGADAPQLSAREEEALAYIARGFTHAQTATRMGISKATVDTYVERIRRKLQLGNKAELTRAALQRQGKQTAGTE
ncbi:MULTISPECIES: response regulator transcription factor [unclassified Streptomyces]|uniref:LuxR C-terminal-related transcriptional regulator n=1 Tax=unclassified Streptomyces TaxID=2593676 RepID=UPI0022579CF8|nr:MULTISPECIES: response regulator transcription factor [unclassified Streptomyces]MCX5063878.1 response regulator transcription factor [Streptomyces sp. NBC_00452]